MKQYKTETIDEYENKLIISNIKSYSDDIKIGSKYNTELDIQVFSENYSGKSTFIIDICTLENFIGKLYEMNKLIIGEAEIEDISIGSKIMVSVNKLGTFVISGILFDCHKEQSFCFKFERVQTYMSKMIEELYNDIVINQKQII